MRQPRHPPAKKIGPYVPIPLIEALDKATEGNPSSGVPAAILAWLALGSEVREALYRESRRENVAEAISAAKKIIKQAVGEQILVEYARSLPKAEQARIIQKSLK
jgi:hypothetical protein